MTRDEEITAVDVPRPRRTFPPLGTLPVDPTPLDLARAYATAVLAMEQRLLYVEMDLEAAQAAIVVQRRRIDKLEAEIARLSARTP